MICPVCWWKGLRSRVYEHGGTTTLMYCQPYYDEEGTYHNHDSNTRRIGFSCSNGHTWVTVGHSGCITPGCEFVSDWHYEFRDIDELKEGEVMVMGRRHAAQTN